MSAQRKPRPRTPVRGRVVYSFGHVVDAVIDPIFQSSALLAPLGVLGALAWAISGLWLGAAIALLIGILGSIGVYARFVAPFRLRVTEVDPATLITQPAAGRDFTVCFISDLHLGEFKREDWLRRIVVEANKVNPDVVLLGGDFVGRTECCALSDLFAPLQDLRAQYGVYGVLGNHDYGIPGPDHSDALYALLPTLGVQLLRNTGLRLADGITLIGLDELWGPGADFGGALQSCDTRPGDVLLVLGHNPDVMDAIGRSEVPAPERALFLFGHTHHGQIRVPFMPGAAIPIKGRLYRGGFRLPQGGVYVSAGTGENTSPTRLGTTPEILVFRLRIADPVRSI
jgi:hypothetical protein